MTRHTGLSFSLGITVFLWNSFRRTMPRWMFAVVCTVTLMISWASCGRAAAFSTPAISLIADSRRHGGRSTTTTPPSAVVLRMTTSNDFSLDPSTTVFVFIEYQNEFTTQGGKFHDAVKDCMERTNSTLSLFRFDR